MNNYKLDLTVFKMHYTEDGSNNYRYWKSQSFEERLRAANYLNSMAYDFPINAPHRLARTYFKMHAKKSAGRPKNLDDLENLTEGN